MNGLEHFLCSTSLWRYLTQRQLLPWVLSGARLGDHLLEIGAGYGPATPQLRKAVARVTSLEYDAKSARHLKARHNGGPGGALRGDATQLPFASQTFSSAIAILVLHHLRSRELQDLMFAEVYRVLRPGGIFLAYEINDSWVHRLGHIRSTFTPVSAGSAFARLTRAGFSRISVDFRHGAFRLGALREKETSTTNTQGSSTLDPIFANRNPLSSRPEARAFCGPKWRDRGTPSNPQLFLLQFSVDSVFFPL